MIFDHEHQHPPSTVPGVDRFTMVCARGMLSAALLGIAALIVNSLTRSLW